MEVTVVAAARQIRPHHQIMEEVRAVAVATIAVKEDKERLVEVKAATEVEEAVAVSAAWTCATTTGYNDHGYDHG